MIAGVVMIAMFGTIAKMSAASETALPAGAIRDSFRHRGMDREYILYLPASLRDNAPLVLVLHGYGGRAMQSGAGMNRIADREGFAVCYPQGAVDGRGKPAGTSVIRFRKG